MTGRWIMIGDVPALACRVTYVGELGWEFYCPMEYGLRLWDTLWEAGKPEGIVAAGYKAIDSLRLEKGYRYWSGEISPDYSPLEAGLGFAVKLNKTEFIGKEALLEQKKAGLKCKFTLLTFDNRTTALQGTIQTRMARQSAAVCGYGYSVEKASIRYLPIEYAHVGMVWVEFFGEPVGAVSHMPLWDPKEK
jgi:4-methylaminobutanoate oxidase (formaldehyde-forming)